MSAHDTALIIIDVQAGIFNYEGNTVYAGEQLIHHLTQLIQKAKAAGVPVIYIQHNDRNEFEPLRQGKPGWEIHPAIRPQAGDLVVQKHHSDAFQETSLQRELEASGIRHLVIAGMQTEYCVDTTCRRAYSLGYDVILAEDGHTTWDTEILRAPQIIAHHNQVLGNLFVTLKSTDEIEFGE